jgi:DNA polymerase-1
MTTAPVAHKTGGHGSDAMASTRHHLRRFRHVWVLDFEYQTTHHVLPVPVAMVAHDVMTGRQLRLGPESMGPNPFDADGPSLFVAFQAGAEASCFLALGWPLPRQWLCLYAEARRLSNGTQVAGNGLLHVMSRYGLPVREAAHKKTMQELIGSGRWQQSDLPAILEYCSEDVADTVALLGRMLPDILREAVPPNGDQALAQAIIRGAFMAENARIERLGLPVDVSAWNLVTERWPFIRENLIAKVDEAYGVFVNGSFSASRFAEYLKRERIPWPTLPSGALALDDDSFRSRAKAEPRVASLRELRVALSQMRGNSIIVDPDGRARTHMRPLASKTGRSQPSTSRYLFGASKWVRSFLRAPEGMTFAYLDFRSQEIAIAAYLAGDELLKASYASGDPYMAFAIQAGLAPAGATKKTHGDARAACKTIVLGVAYGMSAASMAEQSGVSLVTCTELLQRHLETYRPYWRFVQDYRDRIASGQPAYTPLGWRIKLGRGSEVNDRSNGNWPVQSTGSDILRTAVIFCAAAGVPSCGTVHDALCFCVPTDRADELLAVARQQMERAAAAVVGGIIGVDVTRYDHTEVYRDEVGFHFYETVTRMARDG